MTRNINLSLISRYLADECTSEEIRIIEQWLEKNPANRKEFNELKKTWELSDKLKKPSGQDQMNLEEEWAQLTGKIRASEKKSVSSGSSITRFKNKRNYQREHHAVSYLLRLAAVILITLGGSVLVYQYFYMPEEPVDTAESQIREITTDRRQLASISLRDGSNARLSVDSKLRLSEGFKQDNRDVYMEGEVYFDVVPDASRPFVIHVDQVELEVLGTGFSVRSYPDDRKVQVVVAHGAVSMEDRNKPDESGLVLDEGDLGLLNLETGEFVKRQVNVQDYLSWKDGQIIFDDVKLKDAGRDLERWFDIEFLIQDESLESRRLTAVFNNRSLENVMEIIGVTLDVDYALKNDSLQVVIK